MYQPNIPAATDQISSSQADIQGNFQAINTYLAVDHAAFSSADAGHHYFTQGAAPTAADATHVGIYAKALGGNPELYINKTATQIPFTAASKAATGYTYLPSGIILQWGTANILTAGTVVNFPMAFPTACLNVQLTMHSDASVNYFLMAQNLAAASFTGYSTTRSGGASNAAVYYFAIGY